MPKTYFSVTLILFASLSLRASVAADQADDISNSDFFKTIQAKGGDVPFPYTNLLSLLAPPQSVTSSPAGYFEVQPFAVTQPVPDGRSLVRKYATYAEPRLITAIQPFTGKNIPTFVGYAPRSKELEVITWNKVEQKFDFILVRNYGPNSSPIIEKAVPGLCTVCHQNGGPIFARAGWSESSATHFSDKLGNDPTIKAVIEGNGVTLQNASGAGFDPIVRSANDALQNARICRTACGDDLDCRSKVLLGSIEGLQLKVNNPDVAQSLENDLIKLVRPHWPADNYSYPSDVLPDRDPLSDHEHSGTVFHEKVSNIQAIIDRGTATGPFSEEQKQRIIDEFKRGVELTYSHDIPTRVALDSKVEIHDRSGAPASERTTGIIESSVPYDSPNSGGDPTKPRPKVAAIRPENAGRILSDCFDFSPMDAVLLTSIPYDKMKDLIEDPLTRRFVSSWPPDGSRVLAYIQSRLAGKVPSPEILCSQVDRQEPPMDAKNRGQFQQLTQIVPMTRPKGALEVFRLYCGKCHDGPNAAAIDLQIKSVEDLKRYKDFLGESLVEKVKLNKMPADDFTYSRERRKNWVEDRSLFLRELGVQNDGHD